MRDEQYIFSLCDDLLGMTAQRQRKCGFVRGDGYREHVEAFYPALKLVIGYQEQPHGEPVLPKQGVTLLILSYADFEHTANRRLRRNTPADREVLFQKLQAWIPVFPTMTRH